MYDLGNLWSRRVSAAVFSKIQYSFSIILKNIPGTENAYFDIKQYTVDFNFIFLYLIIIT